MEIFQHFFSAPGFLVFFSLLPEQMTRYQEVEAYLGIVTKYLYTCITLEDFCFREATIRECAGRIGHNEQP
jgi:hypothetical protein